MEVTKIILSHAKKKAERNTVLWKEWLEWKREQNSSGDYTAGTTALTTVTEEIAKYVPIVVKLCYAIAGVVAVVGAISVYISITSQNTLVCERVNE